MSLRYLIETFVFFGLMAFFQFEISRFNKDLHISIDEYLRFRALEDEIAARGGLTYRETHGAGVSGHHADGADHQAAGESGHADSDAGSNDHHGRLLSGGGGDHRDVHSMTLEEMQSEEEVLHKDMVHEFDLVREELTLILDLSAVMFVLPI